MFRLIKRSFCLRHYFCSQQKDYKISYLCSQIKATTAACESQIQGTQLKLQLNRYILLNKQLNKYISLQQNFQRFEHKWLPRYFTYSSNNNIQTLQEQYFQQTQFIQFSDLFGLKKKFEPKTYSVFDAYLHAIGQHDIVQCVRCLKIVQDREIRQMCFYYVDEYLQQQIAVFHKGHIDYILCYVFLIQFAHKVVSTVVLDNLEKMHLVLLDYYKLLCLQLKSVPFESAKYLKIIKKVDVAEEASIYCLRMLLDANSSKALQAVKGLLFQRPFLMHPGKDFKLSQKILKIFQNYNLIIRTQAARRAQYQHEKAIKLKDFKKISSQQQQEIMRTLQKFIPKFDLQQETKIMNNAYIFHNIYQQLQQINLQNWEQQKAIFLIECMKWNVNKELNIKITTYCIKHFIQVQYTLQTFYWLLRAIQYLHQNNYSKQNSYFQFNNALRECFKRKTYTFRISTFQLLQLFQLFLKIPLLISLYIDIYKLAIYQCYRFSWEDMTRLYYFFYQFRSLCVTSINLNQSQMAFLKRYIIQAYLTKDRREVSSAPYFYKIIQQKEQIELLSYFIANQQNQ